MPDLWIHTTGFEPFFGGTYNPSWDAAQAAAEVFGGSCEELEVTYELAARYAVEAVPADRPWLLVHFGLSGRSDVSVERYGHNRRGPRDDSEASEVDDTPRRLVDDGFVAMETTLATHRLAKALCLVLEPDGMKAMESRDAGVFVCNAIYFHSLVRAQQGGEVLFVHIPQVEPDLARRIGRAVAGAVLAERALSA